MAKRAAPPGAWDAEAVYDAIAEAWVKTRSGPWPEVRRFLEGLPRGSRLVDVGAGSGRYLKVDEAQGLRLVGVDISRGQLTVARREAPGARLLRGDGRALPLRGGVADGVLVVAVVHHFAARSQRVAALAEARRILAQGGRALITCWSRDADVFEGAASAPGGGPHDFMVPFKADLAAPFERFFHAYGGGELGAEAREAGFTAVSEWTARANCFVEARA
jgi:SAM-dependent methyltransferase